ncbi:MAG: bifunctional [glutamate--ammonia ligase]-adenylyl-L-tyrosine phosphorylase/[glutamate--ammonia-ligase] adenylyltransferase, partial [Gammaproteobacteria bacterium]
PGRARLERLLPRLIELAAECDRPLLALERVLPLIEAIARRSVYLALLSENLPALARLLHLCEASSFVATQITRQPLLLDELLHPETLYHPPDREQLSRELNARLYKCPRGDLEAYMEALRQFRHAQVLRVAAADLTGRLPVPEVSNHLSDIAEVVVEMALVLAWEQLRERHGEPWYEVEGERRRAGFAVIAYGKLGGLELGYSSDLDLIFLHDSRGTRQQSDGPRPLDNATFFTRLAQRTIHLLSTTTPSGQCYEVDTRLRPSGTSGLLVTSLEAFARYQREQAWTWEHQALVRARAVAGEQAVREGFGAVRREVLGRRRDPDRLRMEVVGMREKMRAQLDRSDERTFDLKQGVGGITDIEFMVQYAVLRWSCDHPGLLDWTDNLRLLERMSEYELIGEEERSRLTEAYFAMRGEVHRLALQERKGLVEADRFLEHRQNVKAAWRRLMQPEKEGETLS